MVKPASQCRLNGTFSNRKISDSIKFSTVKILSCWDSRLFEFTTVCRLLELTTVWILDCFCSRLFRLLIVLRLLEWRWFEFSTVSISWYESVLKVYLCCYGLWKAGDLTVVNFWEMQTFITPSLRVDSEKVMTKRALDIKFVWPGVYQGID